VVSAIIDLDKSPISIFTCPNDRKGELTFSSKGSWADWLVCPIYFTKYPVVSGVPIMFPDAKRRQFTLEAWRHGEVIDSRTEMARRSRSSKFAFVSDREIDALAWEYFFWQENAKRYKFGRNRERILSFLQENARAGGYYLKFFGFIRMHQRLRRKLLRNVGSGFDPLLELVKEEGALVIEQDVILEQMLDLASRGAICVCCDLRALPFKNSVFDIVTSASVIHHVWPISAPITEISRVLKADGALFCNDPNMFYIMTIIKEILPASIREPFQRWITSDQNDLMSSPYERRINPYHFIRCLKSTSRYSEIVPPIQNRFPNLCILSLTDTTL